MDTKGLSDWRLQAVSNLAEDWVSPWSGQKVAKGAQVTVVTVTKTKTGRELTLPLPNATALMLNASQRAFRHASILRKKNKIDEAKAVSITFRSNLDAFEYLESMMESVLTAHAGLEAFANDQIPSDYEYISHRRSDVIVEIADKEKIQRHISLCEKISVILPEVLGVKTPKGNAKCWNDYRSLKKLRDRITHMKSEDRRSAQSDVDTVWHALVAAEPPFAQALAVIRHFGDSPKSIQRWLVECPIR
jgi:hypothetical protein